MIFIRKYVPNWVIIAFLILALTLCVYFISVLSVDFADFINSTVSHFLRFISAKTTYIFPFSVFEALLVIAIPVFIILLIIAFKIKGRRKRVRGVLSLLGAVAVLYSMYLLMLGVGYRTTPISERLSLKTDTEITKDELYNLSVMMRDEANKLLDGIEFTSGETRMQYSISSLSEKLCESYSSLNEKYEFIKSFDSCVKPVLSSDVMSDMGITGIYSYFTGEANVNIEYPDYTLPFTAAHELAHQRGICRENEANFVAFLVCIESDEPYIRYSGYLNMYEYLSSALYRTDKELYKSVNAGLRSEAYSDICASAKITFEHSDSFLNRVMDKVNDAYLKSNGTEGTVSYGYVVRLAVAYYKQ